jgi:hypothetical protein
VFFSRVKVVVFEVWYYSCFFRSLVNFRAK